jgi:hypothetical protein
LVTDLRCHGVGAAAGGVLSFSGLTAVNYYESIRRGTSRVSRSDESRGALCMDALKACATAEERNVLSTTGLPDILVTKTLRLLHDRFIGRVILEYQTATRDVPRGIAKFSELTVNAVGNRITELEKLIPGSKLRLLSSLTFAQIGQLPTRPAEYGPKMKKTKRSRG